MSLRSKHLKIVGAAGAAALTVGALSAPALSAPGDLTADATYTCLSGATTPLGELSMAPPSTTDLVAGQKVTSPATLNVILPAGATNLILDSVRLGPLQRKRQGEVSVQEAGPEPQRREDPRRRSRHGHPRGGHG